MSALTKEQIFSAREFYDPGLAKTVTPAFFRSLCDTALASLSPVSATRPNSDRYRNLAVAFAACMREAGLSYAAEASRLIELADSKSSPPEVEAQPDGYAVILPDKASAPMGYWFVGAWNTKETAEEVASKHPGAQARPVQFMNNGSIPK